MSNLLIVATLMYLLGMIKYLLYLSTRNRILFILATIMIFSGFVVETGALVQRSMLTGHGPYTNPFEYCLFLAWVIFGVFLVAEGYFRIRQLGAFMVPIGFLFMSLAMLLSPESGATLPVKAYWLTLHRTLSFLSFGAFSLVFAAGIMYLIQERQLKTKHIGGWYHRLPPLDSLDDMNRKGLVFGFPIVTIGVVAAMVWSSRHYGTITRIDISSALLLAGWAVYAALETGRVFFGWRGRKAATMGIVGYSIFAAALVAHLS